MMGPDPRWQRRPNPFNPPAPPQTLPSMGMPGGNPTGPAALPGGGPLGGAQAPVFPAKPPAFNPPAPPQTLPSVGMPGGNPTGPAAPPGGGGGPGVMGYASAGLDMLKNKDEAPGNAMVKGAGTGAALGSVVPGVGTAIGAAAGAGLGLLTSIFGGGKKHAPRPALLLPPRR